MKPGITKQAIEFHKKRIAESESTIEMLQNECEHDFMYHEYYDGSDWEICRNCGHTKRLPKEMLGIDYGQNTNKK
jgi:hypothetical protein